MEVLGIGSPVVDLIIHVDEHFKIPGHRGSASPLDWEAFVHLLKDAGTPRILTGGSCSNVLKGLASLGVKTALFGKVGADPMGKFFLKTILDLQITPLLIQSDTPTTQVICLIPPDKNRTMLFYPGAGAELTQDDLSDQLFKARHMHIEGHLLPNGRLVEESIRRAKEHGLTVSFDPGSYDLAHNNKERILHLAPDILFANQEEARALTGSTGEEACQKLLPYGKTVVILMGAEGCAVGSREGIIRVGTVKVDVVDTTGAGDLFASGFLFAFLRDRPLRKCAELGNLLGTTVVTEHGAEISEKKWSNIIALANE